VEFEEAEAAARGVDSLRGTLRLALPILFGTRAVIPRLPDFLARHPQLRLEMTVSDERQDLVAAGVDVAIRLGQLEDSAFGARPPPRRDRARPGGRPPPPIGNPAARGSPPPISRRMTASSAPAASATSAGASPATATSPRSKCTAGSTPIPRPGPSPAPWPG